MPAGAEPEGAADGGSVAAFEAYARDGQRRLYRTAYLLCGNVEGAKDLTQTTLAKLFQHWRRASRADNLDAYAKTVLVRTYVAERRRSVRDLLAHRSNPPRPQADPASGVDLRVTLLALLDELPPRAGAMVVLRYWKGSGDGSGAGGSRWRGRSSR
ncbi:sigma factor [Streptomyces cyaneofuscatus]